MIMNFSHSKPKKACNLEFWVELRAKLPNYFDEKTVKSLTCEGILYPCNVSSKTLRLIYDVERLEFLRDALLPEVEEKLKRIISYILPKIKNIYLIPEDALNKQGCVLENYEGKFPIINIKY